MRKKKIIQWRLLYYWRRFITAIRLYWIKTEMIDGAYWDIRKKLLSEYSVNGKMIIEVQWKYNFHGRKKHRCFVYYVRDNMMTHWLGFRAEYEKFKVRTLDNPFLYRE